MRLPPFPQPVRTMSNKLLVNHPANRSAENYVKHVLQLPVTDPRYTPRDVTGDGKDETFCNVYVLDMLAVMGYSYPLMKAKSLITLWRDSKGPMQAMVIQDAITNANMGCPTVFGLDSDSPTWHVGVVLPQPPTINVGDVVVANVGRTNFYGRQLRYAVKKEDLIRVEFFGAP